MNPDQAIELKQTQKRIEAMDADLADSTFVDVRLSRATFNDVSLAGAAIRNCNLSNGSLQRVNLTKLKISQADLRGAAIVESLTDGMTIEGISVTDLMASYRALNDR